MSISLCSLRSHVRGLCFNVLLLSRHITRARTLVRILSTGLGHVQTCCGGNMTVRSSISTVRTRLLATHRALNRIRTSHADCHQVLRMFVKRPLASRALAHPTVMIITDHASRHPRLTVFSTRDSGLTTRHGTVAASMVPHFDTFTRNCCNCPKLSVFGDVISSR